MSIVAAEGITVARGTLEIVRGATFHVDAGDRIGLVGPNGGGKTTLLEVLTGNIEPLSGTIRRRGGLRIACLRQEPPPVEGGTLRGVMLGVFDDLVAMERRLEAAGAAVADGDPAALRRYDALQHDFAARGGYDFRRRVEEVLTGLGFAPATWDRPVENLSGGQRRRGRLAAALLGAPDLLLLDEPTNHLDLDAIAWLEGWLASFGGAVVAVSHDRHFLDAATGKTWDIAGRRLDVYRGGYHASLPKKKARMTERLQRWQSQQAHIARTRAFIDRNIAGQRTKEAKGRQKRLERFIRDEGVARPEIPGEIHVRFKPASASGETVIEARGLSAGYDAAAPVLAVDSLRLLKGRTVAVIGPNGAGKTTLLRVLLGDLSPLDGEVTRGPKVRAGRLSQLREELDPAATALEVVRRQTGCGRQEARDALGAVLISGDDAERPLGTLSGGQRSRVVLARLAAARPNLLALDEPTNHLDIASIEILQEALEQYAGTVLMVTHDRCLVEAAATDAWVVDGGTVACVGGGWEGYLAWKARRGGAGGGETAPAAGAVSEKDRDYRRARQEANRLKKLRRRAGELEERIGELEKRLASLQEEISAAGEAGDVDRVTARGEEYRRVEEDLRAAMDEWERIGEETGL